MTAQELSGRVYHDVGTVLKRTDKVWSTECVVYYEWYTVLMSHSSHTLQVEHVAVRIAECLGIHHLGVRLDSSLKSVQIVHVDDGVANALSSQRVGYQVVATAIQIVGCHDVVTILQYVLQSVSDSCCTTGHCKSCHTTLECCHAVLKHTLCRVGQSSVDVTGIAQSETVGSVLRVVEHIACGLIDGHGAGVGSGVSLFLAYMQLKCLETIILTCTHNLFPFYF